MNPNGKSGDQLEVLISAKAIQDRVAELSKEILATLEGSNLVLVGILKGSLYFLADLSRLLPETCEIDFMQVSSYMGGSSSSGVVKIIKDLDINIEGRDVLIVEDIVDTGATLGSIREVLLTRAPRSLRIVTLLAKRRSKVCEVPVDFIGFEIDDQFVVGYGLDFGERYRGLPSISVLRDFQLAQP